MVMTLELLAAGRTPVIRKDGLEKTGFEHRCEKNTVTESTETVTNNTLGLIKQCHS